MVTPEPEALAVSLLLLTSDTTEGGCFPRRSLDLRSTTRPLDLLQTVHALTDPTAARGPLLPVHASARIPDLLALPLREIGAGAPHGAPLCG